MLPFENRMTSRRAKIAAGKHACFCLWQTLSLQGRFSRVVRGVYDGIFTTEFLGFENGKVDVSRPKVQIHHISCQVLTGTGFSKRKCHTLTQFFFTNNKNNKTSISTYLIICLGIKIFSRYLSVKVPTSLPSI